MRKKPIHNPALCLVREEAMRKALKHNPKMKKFFKLASKKQIQKWKDECANCEPYGA